MGGESLLTLEAGTLLGEGTQGPKPETRRTGLSAGGNQPGWREVGRRGLG